MPSSHLDYIGATGDVVHLDGTELYVGTGLGVRGREWTYSLNRRSIAGQSLQAREASLTASFLTLEAAEAARRVMDRDMYAGTPGRLETPDGWSQRALIVKQEPSLRYHGWMRADMTVLLLDGVWRKLVMHQYGRGDTVERYGKRYTYGYQYDYAPPESAKLLSVDATNPGPFRMVIYGYVDGPEITIGDNSYRFDIEVPTDCHLLVDSRPDPVVELVYPTGISVNAFSSAHRGSGLGSGDYAFEPVKPGVQTVGWDNSFGFDLGVYLEESELPWTS